MGGAGRHREAAAWGHVARGCGGGGTPPPGKTSAWNGHRLGERHDVRTYVLCRRPSHKGRVDKVGRVLRPPPPVVVKGACPCAAHACAHGQRLTTTHLSVSQCHSRRRSSARATGRCVAASRRRLAALSAKIRSARAVRSTSPGATPYMPHAHMLMDGTASMSRSFAGKPLWAWVRVSRCCGAPTVKWGEAGRVGRVRAHSVYTHMHRAWLPALCCPKRQHWERRECGAQAVPFGSSTPGPNAATTRRQPHLPCMHEVRACHMGTFCAGRLNVRPARQTVASR